jgi:hypothetical protein
VVRDGVGGEARGFLPWTVIGGSGVADEAGGACAKAKSGHTTAAADAAHKTRTRRDMTHLQQNE